jgi:hypothetical protein
MPLNKGGGEAICPKEEISKNLIVMKKGLNHDCLPVMVSGAAPAGPGQDLNQIPKNE